MKKITVRLMGREIWYFIQVSAEDLPLSIS